MAHTAKDRWVSAHTPAPRSVYGSRPTVERPPNAIVTPHNAVGTLHNAVEALHNAIVTYPNVIGMHPNAIGIHPNSIVTLHNAIGMPVKTNGVSVIGPDRAAKRR